MATLTLHSRETHGRSRRTPPTDVLEGEAAIAMMNRRAANTHAFDPTDLIAEAARLGADLVRDVPPPTAREWPFAPTTRIASGDRNLSTAGRIVSLGASGATVEVMFPRRGPSVVMLFDHQSDQIYECEVRWRTDEFIGVRFLDILGAVRRRLFFSDQPVPLRSLPNQIVSLTARPKDDAISHREPRWRAAEAESNRLPAQTSRSTGPSAN